MAKITSSTSNLVDTAIGPVAVVNIFTTNYDIDDFVHSTVRSQGIKLQLINKVQTADPRLAKDRPPVNLDGNVIGGF